jgi:hypothetical protein
MRRQITICDRCGCEQGDDEPGMGYWAQLHSDGRLWRHAKRESNVAEAADLCPNCAKDFGTWWQEKATKGLISEQSR